MPALLQTRSLVSRHQADHKSAKSFRPIRTVFRRPATKAQAVNLVPAVDAPHWPAPPAPDFQCRAIVRLMILWPSAIASAAPPHKREKASACPGQAFGQAAPRRWLVTAIYVQCRMRPCCRSPCPPRVRHLFAHFLIGRGASPLPSAACLKFLRRARRVQPGTSNRKATLENHRMPVPFAFRSSHKRVLRCMTNFGKRAVGAPS
jgi:hypothetical protein